jgi:hypothetical protein
MSESQPIQTRKPAPVSFTTNTDRLSSQILACILFSFAVFAIWPAIDIRVS